MARGGRRCSGSIPACAGEPHAALALAVAPGVYPRVCGGARNGIIGPQRHLGLSPRVRGSRLESTAQSRPNRSIPACAGEPGKGLLDRVGAEVYPRVCGGSPCRVAARGSTPGSIPACAGEPAAGNSPQCSARVYPRVCGGALADLVPTAKLKGLSPRVRGSLRVALDWHGRSGSIPACAGEPGPLKTRCSMARVYPRVCGGAFTAQGTHQPGWGLSPRVSSDIRN